MTRLNKSILINLLIFAVFMACREPYDPEINSEDLNVLVVEGHIETEGGSSWVSLSTTGSLDDYFNSYFPIQGAQVRILDQNNGSYTLDENNPGRYTGSPALSSDQQYKLVITTSENGTYESDWLLPIDSSPIDDIGYKPEGGTQDLEVYVSTHGTEEAQYFIWDYEETYIFRAGIPCFYKYDAVRDTVVFRSNPADRIERCWRTEYTDLINIGSASQFAENFIFEKKIQHIPYGSEKMTERYSILVNQRAISREAYTFFNIMEKNTNDMGDIFSPLPSNLSSNLHHLTDPNKRVIGMVTAGNSVSMRVFFDRSEIDFWRVDNPYYAGCEMYDDTIKISEQRFWFQDLGANPVLVVEGPTGGILGYRGASVRCTDCTLRGVNVAPDFWVDNL